MGIQRMAEILNIGDYQQDKPAGPGELAGIDWPPRDDRTRLSGYADYKSLWDGDHQGVLVGANTRVDGHYISVNIPRVIVTIPADLLFGEDLTLTYPDDTQDADRERVEEIWERNDLQTLLYENALDTGYSGDGVWTVGSVEGVSTIKTHPAHTWFPETNPDDVRDILRHRLAWERMAMIGGKEVEFLRVVVHERGWVLHELYRIHKGKLVDASDEDWVALYGAKPEVEQEGVKGEFLLEHVPNFRTARQLCGISEYVGLEDLFGALNARMTQYDGILDRHSDPVMELPWDLWNALTEGGKKQVDRDNLDVVAKDDNGNGVGYVTWDGKLADNMEFINQVLHQISVVSDTAPQLMGRAEWGGNVSGVALKILLVRTLAKVGRKRRYYDKVIPRLLTKAQQLEGVTDPVRVGLDWPDGLPADTMALIEEMDRRLLNQTISRKGAVKQLDGVSEEEAEAVLAEIEDDDQSEAAAVTNAVGGRTLPTIKVTSGLGDVE
jgi:hypothetical protein